MSYSTHVTKAPAEQAPARALRVRSTECSAQTHDAANLVSLRRSRSRPQRVRDHAIQLTAHNIQRIPAPDEDAVPRAHIEA